ncbi:MAG TPA: lactate permease LctP family transporter [Polyangia bacterium]|nr:lactate permease LctP family transporter [Polyangia bacterium]
MSAWSQSYDPLGSWSLSTLVSALPVLTMFFVLLALRKAVWKSALAGMLVAIALALGVFRMPAVLVTAAVGHGVVFGFMRIAWVIVAALFLYEVAVETGQFQVMKESIAALSADRRLQVILIAFCFGAFLEGTGGGGAPVAIAGSFLIGLGFAPFEAATLCLLANTAPVAWGSAGNPLRVLMGVTDLPEHALSVMAGRLLPPMSLILPLWLVRSFVPWRQTLQVWPALLVGGLSFAGVQFYWSNYQDTGLVDIVAALFSLLAMVALLKVWQPRTILRLPGELPSPVRHSRLTILKGWSPFLLSSAFILCAGFPSVGRHLVFAALKFPVPALHNAVLRMPPVAPGPTPESAISDVNILVMPGTAVFVGAIISGLLLGLSPRRQAQIFTQTVRRLVPSLAAISFMVALAYVTRYSGMDTVLGLSLTHTGRAYPFFGTMLGWLGVALTGTDAGSNALFGNLQKVTALQLGLSPILMGAANSCGGVMGKMIDAQSIVVAATATNQTGKEAAIFKAVFWHSVVLACLVGVLVTIYAFVLPGWIPAG